MPESNLSSDDITFVSSLARQAGALAVSMREGVGVHTKSSPSDLVTDADLQCSKLVKSELEKRFPGDLIVSEEDIHSKPGEAGATAKHERVWLIDPIDGTENYVKQDGQWSVMIGFVLGGKPYFGWIFQPSTSTLFYGGTDFGAWKEVGTREPLRYPLSDRLSDHKDVRMMFGWGDRRKHPWVLELPGVRYVPSESLGLKIIKILENHADMFVSLSGRVKLWDTAAPAAIAKAANLDVGTSSGEQLPYPLPLIEHGSSVIIGRPGSIDWVQANVVKRLEQQKTKSSR